MKIKNALLSCGIVTLIVACSTEASYRVEEKITSVYMSAGDIQLKDDKALEKRLSKVLHKQLPTAKLEAIVRFNNVLLVGQVVNNADKLRATDICQKWPGTNKVYNYLTINEQPSLNASSSLANKAMDMIKYHYDVNTDNLKVVVIDGVVYIFGTNAGNLTALDTSINNIYSLDGVHKVINLERHGNMDYYAEPYNN